MSTHLFVLYFGFDVFDGVRGLHFKSDGFARKSLYKYLHVVGSAVEFDMVRLARVFIGVKICLRRQNGGGGGQR